MKKFSVIIASVLAFSFSSVAHASISKTVEHQSERLIEAGNAKAAVELLRSQSKTTAQDWFLFGIAAQKAGKLQEAETAFRQALHLSPRSERIKLELAAVLTKTGKYSEARRLFLDVKASNPPQQVAQNIDRYLALIDKRAGKQSTWRMRASAGLMYDSNVNNATKARTVTMFGLPFTLSRDARAKSDMAYLLKADIDHVFKFSDTLDWQSNVALRWTDYFKLNKYDTLSLSASTGPVFRLDQKTLVSLPFTTNLVSYVNNGGTYSTSIGVAPQIRHQITSMVALNLSGNINRKHFIGNKARDTWSYSVSPGVDITTCGQGTLRFGGTVGRESSGIDIYSNDSWGLNTSLFCPLGTNMAMSIFASYGESKYDARELAYAVKRHDKSTTVGGTVQYAHQPTRLDGILNLTYTHNKSNLTLYGYDKWQLMGTLRKKF